MVKDTLRQPLLFLLFFVVLLALFSVLSLFSFGSDLFLSRLPFVIRENLPVSVLVAITLLHFRILKRPGNRLFSFLLPFLISAAVLIFGYTALDRVQSVESVYAGRYPAAERFNRSSDPDGGETLYYVGVIHRGDGSRGDARRDRLNNVIVVDPTDQEKVFTHFSQGRLEPAGDDLVLSAAEGLRLKVESSFDDLLGKDRFVRGLLLDIRFLNDELKVSYQNRMSFYLLCLSLVFCFLGAGLFSRISKWPLFNVVLSFLAVRGFFYLFRFLRQEIAAELAKVISGLDLVSILPALILSLCGLLMLIVDLLFIPFTRWKEIEGG